MKSRILSQLDECQGFPTPHLQSSGLRDLRDSFVGRAVNHFTTQPSAIYECIFKKCIAIGQLNGGRNSHTIPPTKAVQTKPPRKLCAVLKHGFLIGSRRGATPP